MIVTILAVVSIVASLVFHFPAGSGTENGCTLSSAGPRATADQLASASKDDLTRMVLNSEELGPRFQRYQEKQAVFRNKFLSQTDEVALGFVTVHIQDFGADAAPGESLSVAVALFKSQEGASRYLLAALDGFFLKSVTTPTKFAVHGVGDRAMGETALSGTGQRGTVVDFRRGPLVGLVAAVGRPDEDPREDVLAVACGLAVRIDAVMAAKTPSKPTPTAEPSQQP